MIVFTYEEIHIHLKMSTMKWLLGTTKGDQYFHLSLVSLSDFSAILSITYGIKVYKLNEILSP